MHRLHPRRARLLGTFSAAPALILASLVIVLACQSSGPTAGQEALAQIQQGPSAERNAQGLHRVDIPITQGILYVKAPRPHLEQFDRMFLVPVRIEYEEGVLPWSQSTKSRLRRSFVRTLTKKLDQQKTWRMIEKEKYGPGILTLRIAAKELSVPSRGLSHVSPGRQADHRRHGRMAFAMELYDSNTGEMLVQFIPGRILPIGSDTNVEIDQLRVELSRLATSMGDSLAELAQAVEAVRSDDAVQSSR